MERSTTGSTVHFESHIVLVYTSNISKMPQLLNCMHGWVAASFQMKERLLPGKGTILISLRWENRIQKFLYPLNPGRIGSLRFPISCNCNEQIITHVDTRCRRYCKTVTATIGAAMLLWSPPSALSSVGTIRLVEIHWSCGASFLKPVYLNLNSD